MRPASKKEKAAGISVIVQSAAVVIVACSALIFNLRPLALAMPEADLDGSWVTVLGQAATVPVRWGVDIAFTYGPASALVTRYFTEGYLALAVPVSVAVALTFGLCFVGSTTAAAAGRRNAPLLILLAAAGEAAGLAVSGQVPDNIFFVFAFGVFLLDLVRSPFDRLSRAVVMLGATLMGAVALSKTSYAVLALALFAASDLRSVVLLRRSPVLTPLFLTGFLTAYSILGQHFSDLPSYLRLQTEVVTGYGAAMYSAGSRWELFGFLLAAGALLAVVARVPLRANAWSGGIALAGLALLSLIVVKAGFVRQDTHTQIGWTTLGLVGLSVASSILLHRSAMQATIVAMASLFLLWVVTPLAGIWNADEGASTGFGTAYSDVGRAISAEVLAWDHLAHDPTGFADGARTAKAVALARIREQHPLPQIVGTVDILPSEQTSVIANGLDYHPRPSFQDYSTYTAGLIAANVAFLRGASAPDWVLFGIGGLDDRYATLTEGALWPDLLRLYEPVRQAGPLVALHRRAVPLADPLGPSQERSARLGQAFPVPSGPVFARIVVRPTLLGRLAAAVFRPPALAINVKLADGEERQARFIPDLGAGGFLISPLVESAHQYAQLAIGEGDGSSGTEVTEAEVGTSRLGRLFYAPDIAIEFRPVGPVKAEPSPEARALYDTLTLRRPWRHLIAQIARRAAFANDRLAAPAPTRLSVPVQGSNRLDLTFGIEDGAWTTGKVEGVCFEVSASTSGKPIWQRCLDPLRVAADRGPQTTALALPSGLTSVEVSTSCPHSCNWGWSYWDDIRPESDITVPARQGG